MTAPSEQGKSYLQQSPWSKADLLPAEVKIFDDPDALQRANDAGWVGGGFLEGARLSVVSDKPKDPWQLLLEQTSRVDRAGIIRFNDEFRRKVDFREAYPNMTLANDPIGMQRILPNGQIEEYADKLRKEEEKSGKKEALSIGTGTVRLRDGTEQRFVGIISNWDFFYGSWGVVAGEKVLEAVRYAREHHLPIVACLSSSGIRQQEGPSGLFQMPRMQHAIAEFKRETRLPFIVLANEIWGGAPASIAPQADVLIGRLGTRAGFSGPDVVLAFQGYRMPENAQRVEENLRTRKIDMLVKDEDEFIAWLSDYFTVYQAAQHQHGIRAASTAFRRQSDAYIQKYIDGFHNIAGDQQEERFPFDRREFFNLYTQFEQSGVDYRARQKALSQGGYFSPYERFKYMIKDSYAADGMFLLGNMFDVSVPLTSSWVVDNRIVHTDVAAGLGLIGDRPYLFVFHQDSYIRNSQGEIVKIMSSETPQDLEYHRRMLSLGERLGIPLISFVNTRGARPDEQSERNGQFRAISNSIEASISYKGRVYTFVRNLGSGGGLALTALGHIVMHPDGRVFPSDPESAATILYGPQRTEKQIELTHDTLKATAEDQIRLGLAHSILNIPEYEIPEDPYMLAVELRNDIVRWDLSTEHVHLRALEERRRSIVRSLRGGTVFKGLKGRFH